MAVATIKHIEGVELDLNRSNDRYILIKLKLKKTAYRIVYLYDTTSRLVKGYEISKVYIPRGVRIIEPYTSNEGDTYYVTTVQDTSIVLPLYNKRKLYLNEKDLANELNSNRDFLEKLVKKAMVETMI